jgi:hypothetical protein
MILGEAYNVLRTIGMTDNQYEFSRIWLGRCRSYMSSTMARQRRPCADALLTLAANLSRASARMRQSYQHAQANMLDDLGKRVWGELLGRYGSSYAAV